MSEEMGTLKIYADAECTQPISTIGWNNSIKIQLVDGTEKILYNSARGGESASATVWIKNDTEYDFAITEITFSDARVQAIVSEAWVYPTRPVQMSIIFRVPDNPTKTDVIEAGRVIVHGYFVSRTKVA